MALIEMGKQYTLTGTEYPKPLGNGDGPVRLLATDLQSNFPVVFQTTCGDKLGQIFLAHADGRVVGFENAFLVERGQNSFDGLWLNVYRGGTRIGLGSHTQTEDWFGVFHSRAEADQVLLGLNTTRIACVSIPAFRTGDGLRDITGNGKLR